MKRAPHYYSSSLMIIIILACFALALSTCDAHMRIVTPTPYSTNTAGTTGPCDGLRVATTPQLTIWTGEPFNLTYTITVAHAPYLPLNITLRGQVKVGLNNLSTSTPYLLPKQSRDIWVVNRTGQFRTVLTLPDSAQCYPCFIQVQQPTLAESYFSCAAVAVFSHANDQTLTLTVQKDTNVAVLTAAAFASRLFAGYSANGFNADTTTTPTDEFVLGTDGRYTITFSFEDNIVSSAATMASVIRNDLVTLSDRLGINVLAVSGGTKSSDDSSSNNGGVIAGAIIGVLAGLGLIVFGVLYARKHNKLCYAK